MRIRFKALSSKEGSKPDGSSEDDLGKTRPEGPSARQRASERAPKPTPKPLIAREDELAPGEGQRRRDITEKIVLKRPPNVIEERAPEPKRKDPRRE